MPIGHAMQLEMTGKTLGGREGFGSPRSGARPKNDRVTVEQEGRVFDEGAVGMVREIGEADDLVSSLLQRQFVCGMLTVGHRRVDR
jgi:hypothetical protein